MKEVVQEIINQTSNEKTTKKHNLLQIENPIVFLLFGAEQNTKAELETVSRLLLDDSDGVFVVNGDDIDVTTQVSSFLSSGRISSVLQSGIVVCLVVFGGKIETVQYLRALADLLSWSTKKSLRIIWTPLVVTKPPFDIDRKLLATPSFNFDSVNRSFWGGCCIVDDDRHTLTTAVIYASLWTKSNNANTSIWARTRSDSSEDLRKHLGNENIESGRINVSFEAKSIFIEDPVTLRTLKIVHKTLDRLTNTLQHGNVKEIDFSFAGKIIESRLRSLPSREGELSSKPLYGIIPNPDGDANEYKVRLNRFIEDNYFSQINIGDDVFSDLLKQGFIRSLVESSISFSDLQALAQRFEGGSVRIEKISSVRLSRPKPLPEKAKTNFELLDVLEKIVIETNEKFENLSYFAMRDFFESDDFRMLQKGYFEAIHRIGKATDDLQHKISEYEKKSGEIDFLFSNDPTENAIAKVIELLKSGDTLPRFFAEICSALYKNDEASVNSAILRLISTISTDFISNRRGSSTQSFSENIARAFESTEESSTSKRNIQVLHEKLGFNQKYASRSRHKAIFVVSSENSPFYSAWKRNEGTINANCFLVSANSMSSLAVLAISSPRLDTVESYEL